MYVCRQACVVFIKAEKDSLYTDIYIYITLLYVTMYSVDGSY